MYLNSKVKHKVGISKLKAGEVYDELNKHILRTKASQKSSQWGVTRAKERQLMDNLVEVHKIKKLFGETM